MKLVQNGKTEEIWGKIKTAAIETIFDIIQDQLSGKKTGKEKSITTQHG